MADGDGVDPGELPPPSLGFFQFSDMEELLLPCMFL